MQSKSVVHLIPYDGVGGVEEAARSIKADRAPPGVTFRLQYLFPKVTSRANRRKTFNLLQMLRVTAGLVREGPDVIVLSLWRSVAVGLLVKLLRPKLRLVLFLHNAKDAHLADKLLTRLGKRFASAVWADSRATLEQRFAAPFKGPTNVISFVLRAPVPPSHAGDAPKPEPRFVFWGRFSGQKNIPRTLRLFAEIRKRLPRARCHLIGATPQELDAWRSRVDEMGLGDAVTIDPIMGFDEITKAAGQASFYLQTSHYEGMAMSVVEAMQLGLVPVVTPVGQIAQYCRDGENAVLWPVDETDQAGEQRVIAEIARLLEDGATDWQSLRRAAMSEWNGAMTYQDSFFAAFGEVLS